MSTTIARCTWQGCTLLATHPQRGRAGNLWAQLCDAHNEQMDKAFRSVVPGNMLSAWVKAQGGSKAATQRMVG